MKIDFRSRWGKIRSGRFIRTIAPGIQIKLSFFMGLFIAVILITSAGIQYIHQKQILEQGFQNEIEPALRYINSVAVDFENLRHNLILIEDMKQRIKEKTKELRKYSTVVYRKKDSFFNTVKGFGGTLGMSVNYEYTPARAETFYSVYLTTKEISGLEKIIKSQLKYRSGEPVKDADFKRIQAAAAASAYYRRTSESLDDELRSIRKRISAESASAETPGLKKSAAQIETRIKHLNKLKTGTDYRLQTIIRPLYEYNLVRLEETGMQSDYIRIISAAPDGTASYDTGSYMKESRIRFSPLFEDRNFKDDRKKFFASAGSDGYTGSAAHDYETGGKNFSVEYRPVYKNPATYERIRIILKESMKNPSIWKPFIEEDIRISALISEQSSLIRERVSLLKEKRLAPGKDADYRKLYGRYSALLAERDAAFNKLNPHRNLPQKISQYYTKEIDDLGKTITQQSAVLAELQKKKSGGTADDEIIIEIDSVTASIDESRKNINSLKSEFESAVQDLGGTEELSAADAFHRIRDAALYDFIQLKFRNDPLAYKNYLKTLRARTIEKARWAAIRSWITGASSETGIPEFLPGYKGIKTIDNGLLAYARSEIEEYMWRIDGTPIAVSSGFFGYDTGRDGLLSDLMRPIVTGYNIIAVDRSDGIARITENRRAMMAYSSATALGAVILAYFFSGFMVRRISRIKAQAARARAGDMRIEFPRKGLDEIEDLAESLNSMMKGLRERDEMKSELAAAGGIQKQLLPEIIPDTLGGHYSTAAYYRAMQGVGGDYYDFIELSPGRLLFCIGDVSNHGVGPAIVMAGMRAQLRGITSQGESGLIEIMLRLNERLFIDTPGHIFVTFFAGIIDSAANELTYVSAGHMRPVIYRYKTETVETLQGGGLPLGMDDNSFFSETISLASVKLAPGDLFFQYTDGLTEAMDRDRNIYGDERLVSIIGEYGRKKIEVLINSIAQSVGEFTGTDISDGAFSQLGDDLAMIALKRLK